MLETFSRFLGSGITGSVLILLLSTPSGIALLSRSSPKSEPEIYQDKDGVATPESVAKYSAKFSKISIASLTVAGFGFSVGMGVYGIIHTDQSIVNWLTVMQWVRPCNDHKP
jgi:hypothetical protein